LIDLLIHPIDLIGGLKNLAALHFRIFGCSGVSRLGRAEL
jgi:hypothetical protein